MYTFRLNLKRISIWILLLAQIVLILSYFFSRVSPPVSKTNAKISFLKSIENVDEATATYHTLDTNIILKSVSTKNNFIDFNSSLCFKNGTDLISMKISKVNWKCNCLPGWHGNDCGQPEVLWRALIANKKPIKIKGPRTFERRLIYLFEVNKFSEHIADIRINELGSTVDLFILYEDPDSTYLLNKLNQKNTKAKFYISKRKENIYGKKVKTYLKNLRNDDVILSSNLNEIPNQDALTFLKFYDHWPQPIKFRFRWSVFGFFWLHPSRTIIGGGACTVSFLKEIFNNQLTLLTDNKTLSNPIYKGLMLGDLNHYGGWYCEYCNDPLQIVEFLASKPRNVINWDKVDKQKIDNSYIEDLIENGVYIDGKTQLVKAHKYRDNYFAPRFVNDHNWIYDFLLINLYSKLDYYEAFVNKQLSIVN
ncbi:hypothetical protein NQ315_003890 [Exocentrus adspersus]|uniref:Beta-1,4-mannosyl-glycoprotein 4-beta-N-acetylglucosaminyltransferase n=1 Tax=Exocentrus adspersus TaxID=1586481 RepID=A0AAV8VY58_9CUCU|nr:hypothetical protein NQ315_003890 [Exocentrus adspersus]